MCVLIAGWVKMGCFGVLSSSSGLKDFSLQLGWVETDLHAKAGGLTNSQQQTSTAHRQPPALLTPGPAGRAAVQPRSRGAAQLPPPPVP